MVDRDFNRTVKKGLTRVEFLARRKSGIGGSDIAAILGLSPWRTALDVWLDKTSPEVIETPSAPIGTGAALWWGSRLEEVIGKAYSEATGRRIQRHNALIVDAAHPYMIGDVDFLAYTSDGKTPATKKGVRTDLGIEVKTARFASDEWGADGTDEIPAGYLAQVQWYMGLLPSVQRFDLVALFGGSELRIYPVERDDDLIAGIRDAGERFWRDFVAAGCPPPPATAEDVRKLFPAPQSASATASPEIEKIVAHVRRLSRVRIDLTAEEDDLKDKIAVAIGDAEELKDADGAVLATFRNEKRGRVLRVKKEKEG